VQSGELVGGALAHHWIRPIRVCLSGEHDCQSCSLAGAGVWEVPGGAASSGAFVSLLTQGT
jgi:hypothetical protein